MFRAADDLDLIEPVEGVVARYVVVEKAGDDRSVGRKLPRLRGVERAPRVDPSPARMAGLALQQMLVLDAPEDVVRGEAETKLVGKQGRYPDDGPF